MYRKVPDGSMLKPRGIFPSVSTQPLGSSLPVVGSTSKTAMVLAPRLAPYRTFPVGWMRISEQVLVPGGMETPTGRVNLVFLGSVEMVWSQIKAPRSGSKLCTRGLIRGSHR